MFDKYLAFEKSVGCVVYRMEKEKILFLLVQYRSWQWDFPKGHMEKGESEEQTMAREIREETGIVDLSILQGFRTQSNYFYVAKGNEKKERQKEGRGIYIFKRAVFFAAQTFNKDVKIDFENKNFAWLTYGEVLDRLKNDGSIRIIKEVFAELDSRKNVE
ncbi:MAG: NUDIX hydrolase [Candidatus Moranbacteria bacterium GW2011_GWE1_36_7]|nr:MAG: NUDIX hydrolase [Candidatus Moranbacteria bacterium GW2011_GWD2_36_12]KKQ06447.1 MAG: NUDIX hydrolase [Candidatus Moranbacteria bacterium GW2011_GWE2_36_40]KKQ15497.1 MAG: NUDIX hydrolase [Candidatus Moranbacteria bacterium GW2011_GWE1_36_7]